MSHGLRNLDIPSRRIGLGQAPSAPGVVDSVLSCGFTQVPVIEYVTWTVDLPVADGFIDGTFGDEIDVLQNPKTVPGVTTVDSSFVINGILQVDMLVIGFGVHGFAEPQQGTQIGNYATPASAIPAGSVPISPDTLTTQTVLPGGVTMTPALLEWGVDAQNALWHLMNAYQFRWIMQQRYQLVQELAADVAYFGSYAEAVAAGSSQQAFQRYVNRVNDKYSSAPISDPGVFLPINAQRVGATTASGSTSADCFHPTRAYDTLDVTYGGLRVQGMTGSLQPFRKLFKPVLLERGIPIGMILSAQDEYHQNLMQQYLSNNDHGASGGTTHTLMQIGAGVSGNTLTDIPELTFSTTAETSTIVVDVAVNTDRVLMKGGAFQLAILIKGFEVWGPWKNYITKNLVANGVVDTPATAAS
ncbi:MAG TPA: hypothetical protein VEJ87_03550 [Acidimicrobiales bacterium]|nr:hypothetical protein [Acidimicrobiales bacterium]